MAEFNRVYLVKDMLEILRADMQQEYPESRFPCRPLSIYNVDYGIALGRFTGTIRLAGIEEFLEALNDLVSDQVAKVILDFAHVTLSKTAVGSLVNYAATVYGVNKRLYLYKTSEQIKSMLNELDILHFFTFLETEDEFTSTLLV